jgi:hypothetical protein
LAKMIKIMSPYFDQLGTVFFTQMTKSGTDVMIFFAEFSAKKLSFVTQNKSKF